MRPGLPELRSAIGMIGRVLIAGALMHVPAIVVALGSGEVRDASAMIIGAAVGGIAGLLLRPALPPDADVDSGTGAVIVATAWLAIPATVALSFHLGGHTGSLLDAYFDAMSGLTTSGLSVMQDIDHVGSGMQVLRHTLHFAGGQGIVLVLVTVIDRARGGVGSLVTGEGREERLVPNVLRTARLIYLIATAWLIVGTTIATLVLVAEGFAPGRALLHAVLLFAAAFDTGGFSMMSTSVAYYHSAALEIVLSVLMIAGALSFPVHYGLWRRRVGHVGRSLGLRTFALTTVGATAIMLAGLAATSVHDDWVSLLRTGAFTALSAATGTGFAVVPGSVYATWGQFTPAVLVTLMGIGAMAGSTAGGVKVERVAILAKAVVRDLRRALTPSDAVVVATTAGALGGPRQLLTDRTVRAAALITIMFFATYVGGAMAAVAYGATVTEALFESVSATATVGLSVGVTAPGAPVVVRAVTIAQMWLGRLEFLAAFALVGWLSLQAGSVADHVLGTVRRRRHA